MYLRQFSFQFIAPSLCSFFSSALCPVPTINNGAVPSGEYKEGDTVTVTCDSGYSLEAGQSSTITCGDNGSWDTLPRCLGNKMYYFVTNFELACERETLHQ